MYKNVFLIIDSIKELQKAKSRDQKQSMTRSILGPVNPVKVSKAPGKSRISHQKMIIPCDILRPVEKITTNSSTSKRKEKQAFKVKDTVHPSLRPIRLLRVSKPGKIQLSEPRMDRTKLLSTIGPHRLKREGDSRGFRLLYLSIRTLSSRCAP